jgi:hypothetical protein
VGIVKPTPPEIHIYPLHVDRVQHTWQSPELLTLGLFALSKQFLQIFFPEKDRSFLNRS